VPAIQSPGGVQGCYLLHFDRPIYRAQHYLGWSTNVVRRVALHQRGKGARLVAQALAAGIDVELVRVWPQADKAEERALKRRVPKSYCPTCRPAGKGKSPVRSI
jgi:predicted GIY-YIG superfamily endonuclease